MSRLSKWDIPVPNDIDPLCWDRYQSPHCHHYFPTHAHLPTHPPSYFRKQQLHQSANIKINDTKFIITINVHNFSPDELLVHFNDDHQLIIEGKHEEKKSFDDQSYVSRHFKRRYEVPDDLDEDEMVCNLSSDGILTVHVPRKSDTFKKDNTSSSMMTSNTTDTSSVTQNNTAHCNMNVSGV